MELPKDYVSWSQMEAWEHSKAEWIKTYIKKEKKFETNALKNGKKFAQDSELGLSNDPSVQFLLDLAPTMKWSEKEYMVYWPEAKVYLLAKLDKSDELGFRDQKTGTVEWNQERVNTHGQLAFYALARQLEGHRNDDVWLDWFPYKNGKPTGEIISFQRNITKDDIKNIKKRIKNYIFEVKHYKVLNLKD